MNEEENKETAHKEREKGMEEENKKGR